MDNRTVKSISEAAGFAARYDNKIKIWQFSKEGAQPLTFTSAQLDNMTPDSLRRKLGIIPSKKHKKAMRKPRAAFDPNGKINLLVTENPKRAGSKAHAKFALYREGMTAGEFIAAGGDNATLRWDSKHKLITITN